MKSSRLWMVTLGVLATAVVLLIGSAYARYREELVGDQSFQVKPGQQLAFATQQWQQDEDGNRILTFSMEKAAENCRVFLAVSEGVTAPENLQVTLTLPAEGTVAASENGTEAVTVNAPVTLTAKGEAIMPGSSLYSVFGSGYVFRFYEPGAEGQTPVEMALDLKSEEVYTLTISGLSAATEQTSLLRLFVDHMG